jgi:hypothetical protein
MQGSKAVGHCKPLPPFHAFASHHDQGRSGSCTAVPARYLRRRLIRAEPSRVLDDTRELLSSSLAPFARFTTTRPDPSHRSFRCLLSASSRSSPSISRRLSLPLFAPVAPPSSVRARRTPWYRRVVRYVERLCLSPLVLSHV